MVKLGDFCFGKECDGCHDIFFIWLGKKYGGKFPSRSLLWSMEAKCLSICKGMMVFLNSSLLNMNPHILVRSI